MIALLNICHADQLVTGGQYQSHNDYYSKQTANLSCSVQNKREKHQPLKCSSCWPSPNDVKINTMRTKDVNPINFSVSLNERKEVEDFMKVS